MLICDFCSEEGRYKGDIGPWINALTPGIKILKAESGCIDSRSSSSRATSCSSHTNFRLLSSRKQRRCWSLELNHRFVNAVQQLQGSQGEEMKNVFRSYVVSSWFNVVGGSEGKSFGICELDIGQLLTRLVK
ncbi:hypothetical protein V6N13_014188 [Hibiscus sabdariffa]|uniref:Uncharacterized protein n=1 Tax=Hibiscus sabdariffa TaxID=183260 RepID=A0ABR2RUN8_9ROSI